MTEQATDLPDGEDTEPEATPTPEPEVDEAEQALEAEAREMGWVPQDKWRGDPEQWRPAKDFVERGKEVAPIIASQLRKERAERAKEQAEFKQTIARMERMTRVALTKQRSDIESKYEAMKEQAVEAGDTKAYKAATTASKEALKKFDESVEEKADKDTGQQGLSAQDEATARSWWQANPDLEKAVSESPKIAGAVNEAWRDVQSEMFGAPVADMLQEVKNRIAEEFGDRIGLKPRPKGRAPAVEGAGGRGPSGSNGTGKLASKLPAEARAQGIAFIKEDGLFLEKGEKADTHLAAALERYAKDYFETTEGAA